MGVVQEAFPGKGTLMLTSDLRVNKVCVCVCERASTCQGGVCGLGMGGNYRNRKALPMVGGGKKIKVLKHEGEAVRAQFVLKSLVSISSL